MQTLDRRSDIRETWREYSTNRTEYLRNELTEHYLPLVRKLAEKIHSKLPREVQLDDIVSAGIFGLMHAVKYYDIQRNVRFETFAVPRIRGAILDELRRMDWVPRLEGIEQKKLGKQEPSFEKNQ